MNFIWFLPSPNSDQISGVSYTLLLIVLQWLHTVLLGEWKTGLAQKSHGYVPLANAKNEGGKVRQGGFAAVAAALPARPGLALLASTRISSWTKGMGFPPQDIHILI